MFHSHFSLSPLFLFFIFFFHSLLFFYFFISFFFFGFKQKGAICRAYMCACSFVERTRGVRIVLRQAGCFIVPPRKRRFILLQFHKETLCTARPRADARDVSILLPRQVMVFLSGMTLSTRVIQRYVTFALRSPSSPPTVFARKFTKNWGGRGFALSSVLKEGATLNRAESQRLEKRKKSSP